MKKQLICFENVFDVGEIVMKSVSLKNSDNLLNNSVLKNWLFNTLHKCGNVFVLICLQQTIKIIHEPHKYDSLYKIIKLNFIGIF